MAIKRFTVKEVEDAARDILLDTNEGAYRFEPKEIYSAMKDGLLRIRHERPSSRYVGGLLVDLEFVDGSTSTSDIPAVPGEDFKDYEVTMEERWKEAVVYYVVHRMYLKDDPDTKNDALAERYFNMYKTALGG